VGEKKKIVIREEAERLGVHLLNPGYTESDEFEELEVEEE